MISLDDGPVAKSQVFQQVMRYLNVDVRAHLPQARMAEGTLVLERPLLNPKNGNGGAENRVVLLTRKHLRINGFSPGRSIDRKSVV